MPGLVCLQGGGEFGLPCRDMDAEVLRRVPDGPVVVVALAARPGGDHDTATANALAYYGALGAREVRGAPDARTDAAGARAAVADAGVVVLPGGSPSGLLTALRDSGLDESLRSVLARGGAVSGASAGAMVLCEWTVLPDDGPVRLVEGLGIVPGILVVPHFDGSPRWGAALDHVDPDAMIVGLPECSGLLVDGDGGLWSAVGAAASVVLGEPPLVLEPGVTRRIR